MAIKNNPGTVSSNVVFTYDVADTRNSYIGEPTTNLANFNIATQTLNTDTPAQIVSTTNSSEATYRGRLSRKLSILSGYWNAYFYDYNTGVSSTKFAVSYKVKVSGGAHPNTIIGGGYIYGSAGTFFPTPSFTYLEDGWYQATMLYSGTSMTLNSLTGMNGGGPGVIYITDYQAEAKDHSTPFAGVAGTRSNTQGLLDISGYSRTINLANVSFNTSAQMIFDGTDDYAEVSSFNVNENNEFTLEAIIYPNTVSTNQSIINKRTSNDFWPIFSMGLELNNLNGYYSSPVYGQSLEGVTGTSNVITAGRYHHVAFSKGAGGYTTMKLFVNGVSVPYSNFLYGSHINAIATSDKPIHIGRTFDSPNWIQPFNGLIPVSKVYNRQLTDAEILSNFNNYKKRFNL